MRGRGWQNLKGRGYARQIGPADQNQRMDVLRDVLSSVKRFVADKVLPFFEKSEGAGRRCEDCGNPIQSSDPQMMVCSERCLHNLWISVQESYAKQSGRAQLCVSCVTVDYCGCKMKAFVLLSRHAQWHTQCNLCLYVSGSRTWSYTSF